MATFFQDWTPLVRSNFDFTSLDLIPEEGFVLSRIDGATPARQLSFLTGLGKNRVENILDRLVTLGAVVSPDQESAEGPGGSESLESRAESPGGEGDWRRHYQRELRHLTEDRRQELARACQGQELRALCFDPSPRVIAALMENPGLETQHARLIAKHHRSGQGLSQLSNKLAFLRDRQVSDELLRNPLTPEVLLQRILLSKNLNQMYLLSASRNVTERARNTCRKTIRNDFFKASSADKVNLIWKTEGRCLALLNGLPLDGRTAALLCQRPISSQLLVRNLARWPSTPAPVLHHLIRQASVKRSPDLRHQILRHPNAPSRLKRS